MVESLESPYFYTVRKYNDNVYRIVNFKGGRCSSVRKKVDKGTVNSSKLSNNLQRSRMTLLELGLCNPWEYFFTGTINGQRLDRYNLDAFKKKLGDFISNQNKKYGVKIKYVLVPEPHKDNAWHVHGFLSGLPPEALLPFQEGMHPARLCNKGYFYWRDYHNSFGFNSLGPIHNVVASAVYITKYISKDLESCIGQVGKRLFLNSQRLFRSSVVSTVSVPHVPVLDDLCTEDYEYCRVGMTIKQEDHLDWTFPIEIDELCGDVRLEYLDLSQYEDVGSPAQMLEDFLYEYEQLKILK